MKFYSFSFKNEAVWSMIFNLAGLAAGVLILLAVWLLRRAGF
jgi:hypothetical protein